MVLSWLVRALFPPRCVSCAAPGGWWCTDCSRRLIPVGATSAPDLDGLLAAVQHRDPVTHLVKALKYRHAKVIVPEMATLLVPLVRALRHRTPLLVPVPLHPRRLRERGHNQSALIAEAISESSHLPVSGALTRVRYTRTQTGLG